jgi:hypothetical protein
LLSGDRGHRVALTDCFLLSLADEVQIDDIVLRNDSDEVESAGRD